MTITIVLPDHIQTWIDAEIDASRFATEKQLIVTALERMADDRMISPDMLDEQIAEPLAQIERGEGQPWTDELCERIEADARRNADPGHEVRDEIKY